MTASTSRAPLTTADYPLSVNRPDLLRTPTGKALSELTMDAVVSGALTAADVRIAPETLLLQAEIADAARRPQLAANFRRAAEMTAIPDAEVLLMYNALRPRASSAEQLDALAERLEGEYGATACAALVREAAEVYGRRDLLARPEQD
ncbi:diol dehydratase small subunit [Pseudonocardia charpentierae]|uniref:Diol dehydratase small subunit n=1 Tax=Pseudonocardia charpentierae TaxID=3075545 RepID=A0ABU2N4S2_9PSEU|nr:diol dehydratase small subunit [Pseudonocardia sp. DSM 45834]MDT0348889.1 diol dehydratase small subunit [Pseudonocardia sp. DSM 45834]